MPMAQLPEQLVESPTVRAIFSSYEKNADKRLSRRLGASIVGKECGRAIWYDFRWAGREEFDGRMLRLFQTGQMEESRIVANLRAIGCEVHFPAEGNPEQFEFTAIGGHLVCKIDAAAVGLPEAEKTWHTCEFKTHNAKSFASLQKEGLKKSKPQHYAQLIIGMKLSGMTRGLYFAVNKDTDELYVERLRWEDVKDDAERVIQFAQRIIESERPPEPIATDRSDFRCRFCTHLGRCHGEPSPAPAVPVLVTCRSCVHSTPVIGDAGLGAWRCDKHGRTLDEFAQRKACDDHLFIPDLITFAEYVDANPDENWIEYRNGDGGTWRNGKRSSEYRSVELTVLPDALVGADKDSAISVHAVKQVIGGVVTEVAG